MYETLRPIGTLNTKHARDIDSSRIGVGFEKMDTGLIDPSGVYAPLGACGLKWARVHTGWYRTETEPGVYNFAWLDEMVDALVAQGITPWLDLLYGNSLYTKDADNEQAFGFPPYRTEGERKAWTNYVRELVKHFKDRVQYYEIWNEPDGRLYWKPGMSDGTAYGMFACDTALVIKAEYPEAKVLAFALAQGVNPGGLAYIREGLETGLWQYIDYITIHRYRQSPEQGFREGVLALRSMVDQYDPRIGLIQGERGCPSRGDGFGAMGSCPWNETTQAKWIARMIVTDLSLPFLFTSYFTAVDIPRFPGRDVAELWAYFGLLREDTCQPKQGYHVLKCVCTFFHGDVKSAQLPVLLANSVRMEECTTSQKWENLNDNRETIDASLCCTAAFERDGAYAFAYWYPAKLPEHAMEALISVCAYGMGLPKVIDPMTGEVFEIEAERVVAIGMDSIRVRGLPLRDYPMLLAFDGFLSDDAIQR